MIDIELFNIVCKKCETAKRPSQTHVHINWEKRNWVYVCLNTECGNIEAFNEMGKRILPRDKDKNENESDKN